MNSTPWSVLFRALAMCWVTALRGAAPDTIAGTVYHETGWRMRGGSGWQTTISFGADGRYRFLLLAEVPSSSLQPAEHRPVTLLPLPREGTYSYNRTSDIGGIVTLNEPTGSLPGLNVGSITGSDTVTAITIVFSDELHGSLSIPGAFVKYSYFSNASTRATQALSNTSFRGMAAATRPLIAGFVVPERPGKTVDVLIRVIGSSLARFGVAGTWSDPDFELHSNGTLLSAGAHFSDWSGAAEQLQPLFSSVGAFPLDPATKEAVRFARLPAGSYTVVASPTAGDPGGDTLVEVYVLP